MGRAKQRRGWSKQVVGEWLIPSAEGRSYGYVGDPKLVSKQMEGLKADLMGRVAALEASER